MPKGYPKDLYPEQYGDVMTTPVSDEPLSIEQALLEIQQAQASKDSAAALTKIGDTLDRLSDDDREKLLGTPTVMRLVEQAREKIARDGKPGTTVCDSKGRVLERVEHTKVSMMEEFGLVKWMPMESRWISFNGIQIYVVQGDEAETPFQFRDIAMEAWSSKQNQLKDAAAILKRNLGPNSMIMTGAGDEVWRGDNQ